MDRPDLDVEALRAALPRWGQIDVVEEATSTNAVLLARPDSPDRTLLAAEFQNAGRGRFDRAWTSPPRAGVTASFLLRPSAPIATWGWLPLLAGVAVSEAVAQTSGLTPRLKWPNDVLLGGAKLAGILTQSTGDVVVVGIGINVSTSEDELPPDVAATSLALAGDAPDRTSLLAAIADRLDTRVAQWDDCRGDAEACGLAAAYRALCDTVGQSVRVTLADGEQVTGTGQGIDADGHLLMADRVIAAGDIEHLRSTS